MTNNLTTLRKEFEDWLTLFPFLKGGNNFKLSFDNNGLLIPKGEYDSSWMQNCFEAFLHLKTQGQVGKGKLEKAIEVK